PECGGDRAAVSTRERRQPMSSQSLERFFRACQVARPPRLMVSPGDAPPSDRETHVLAAPFALVGSDPRCDIVLDDPGLSDRHCYLQAIGAKVLCVDLGSARGVDPGDGPARAGWIDDARVVRVGGHVLRLAPDVLGATAERDDA